jgi:Holliday junction resolvasome RuvABC endonuclease subunit
MAVTGNGHATHQRVVEFITQNLKQWGAEVRMSPD